MDEQPQFKASRAYGYSAISTATAWEALLESMGIVYVQRQSIQIGVEEYEFDANFDTFDNILSAVRARGLGVLVQREPLTAINQMDVTDSAINLSATQHPAGSNIFYTVAANRRLQINYVSTTAFSPNAGSDFLDILNASGATVISIALSLNVGQDVSPINPVILDSGYSLQLRMVGGDAGGSITIGVSGTLYFA